MVEAAALSLAGSLGMIRLLVSPSLRKLALDQPNERSLHTVVVPRTGGLAVLVGTSAGLALGAWRSTGLLWIAALGLGALSFLDDRRGLSVRVRLLAQATAALLVAASQASWQQFYWAPFVFLVTLWMINLYNFMDGADGLAGGMGLFGFASYAMAAHHADAHWVATFSACLSAACLGFLSQNVPPARIFMGDAGSTVLGLCAASVGLYGVSAGLWRLWFPGLIFLPFIMDASITLLRRAQRRERVWEAHREHYYQRLIRSGWSHRKMALSAYLLMAGTGTTALAALAWEPRFGWAMLGLWVLVFAVAMRLTDRRWSLYLEADGRRHG